MLFLPPFTLYNWNLPNPDKGDSTTKRLAVFVKCILAPLHDGTWACTEAKMIWSCLPPHWRLLFLSAQCSNACCLANNRAHCCSSGSSASRAVNQHGNRTRGTKLGCEVGPTEKRRFLSRLGSVCALFWCNITENADLCSYYCAISHHSDQVRLRMSSRAFLCSSALLKACWCTAK